MNRKYILFLIFLLCQQAKIVGQSTNKLLQTEITASYSGASLYTILSGIQENYKINFFYSDNLIPLDRKVSIDAKKQPLNKVLDLIFKGTNINYKVVGDQIVLIKEPREEIKVDQAKPVPNSTAKDTLSKPIKSGNNNSIASDLEKGKIKNIRDWKYRTKVRKPKLGRKSNKDSTDISGDTLQEEDKNPPTGKPSVKKSIRPKKPVDDKFTLELNLTAGTSYRNLDFRNKEGEDINKKRKDERHKLAFVSEIQCSYRFSQSFSFSGGLGYMNLGERGKYKDSSTYTNNFSYITIPLTASYHFRLKEFSFKTGLGVIPCFMAGDGSNALQFNKLGKPPKDTITKNTFNLAYAFHVEGAYRINKISLVAGLTYRHFFFSVYKKPSAVKEYNYLYGIYAGIKYHF